MVPILPKITVYFPRNSRYPAQLSPVNGERTKCPIAPFSPFSLCLFSLVALASSPSNHRTEPYFAFGLAPIVSIGTYCLLLSILLSVYYCSAILLSLLLYLLLSVIRAFYSITVPTLTHYLSLCHTALPALLTTHLLLLLAASTCTLPLLPNHRRPPIP